MMGVLSSCYCVDPRTGKEVPGTRSTGDVTCGAPVPPTRPPINPPRPQPPGVERPCDKEKQSLAITPYRLDYNPPTCKPDGTYEEKQCAYTFGRFVTCFCVHPFTGKEIPGTRRASADVTCLACEEGFNPSFNGQDCEIDMCYGIICSNGGKCIEGRCSCPSAFVPSPNGKDCVPVDPCETNPANLRPRPFPQPRARPITGQTRYGFGRPYSGNVQQPRYGFGRTFSGYGQRPRYGYGRVASHGNGYGYGHRHPHTVLLFDEKAEVKEDTAQVNDQADQTNDTKTLMKKTA